MKLATQALPADDPRVGPVVHQDPETLLDYAVVKRPHAICAAMWPLCPQCGVSFSGLTMGTGWIFKHCNQKVRPDDPRWGQADRCNQHAFILGAGDVCIVWAVSKDEFRQLRSGFSSAQILGRLQVITFPHGISP